MPLLTPTLPSRWMITVPSTDDPDILPSLVGQTFLAMKTPLWSTRVDTAVNGTERRGARWSYPIYLFRMGFEFLRDGSTLLELQRLVTFFNMHGGSNRAFFYYDRKDHSVLNCPFGTGDGTTTKFQLVRTTTIGGITFTEPVRGLASTPTVTVNGTPTAVTVNDLGYVTFASPPAAAAILAWTGTFYHLCRFEKDSLDGLREVMNGFWDLSDLGFRSFKP